MSKNALVDEVVFSHGGPKTEMIRDALARVSEVPLMGLRAAVLEDAVYFRGAWTHRFFLRFGTGPKEADAVFVDLSVQEDSGEPNKSRLRAATAHSVIRLTVRSGGGDVEPLLLPGILKAVMQRFRTQFTTQGVNVALAAVAVA